MKRFKPELFSFAGITVLYLIAQLLTSLAALGMALDYARSGPEGPPPSLDRTVLETMIEVLALPLGLFLPEAKEPNSLLGVGYVLLNGMLWGAGFACCVFLTRKALLTLLKLSSL